MMETGKRLEATELEGCFKIRLKGTNKSLSCQFVPYTE